MSGFLSRIKARLEPGQQFTSEETGWVRAAVATLEESLPPPEVVELVQRMGGVTLDSAGQVSEEKGTGGDGDILSPRAASRILWETGSLEHRLPNGFCSIAPHESSKVRSAEYPVEFFTSEGSPSSLWDVLLVDWSKDVTLVHLAEICLEIVRGLEPNSADTIRKVAGMVSDFYGGPVFETSHLKATTSNEGVTLLSQVKIGLCRPRALLFKFLGDVVGLKSRLLMGLQLDSVPCTSLICSNPRGHLTNVVNLNGNEVLVDVLRHPGHLRPFTVKALVMYHISGPGDSDSAEYDSCDSPLEPNSPLFFGPQDSASPSQSEPDITNPTYRLDRRKSLSDERGNKSSPELPSEVRYFQRRHMVDGARSFPSSPEHPQAQFRSFRPIKSQDGSNSRSIPNLTSDPCFMGMLCSSPETGVRARAPSKLSGSRRLADEERASSPENCPQLQILPPSIRRRSSSFCVREKALDKSITSSSESRRFKKRTNTPEISDEAVRAMRAMKEIVKQVQSSPGSEQEFRQGRKEAEIQLDCIGSEPNSLNFCGSSSSIQSVTSDAVRFSSDSRQDSGASSTITSFLPEHPIMPYPEWNIDFNELKIGIRIGIGSFGEVFRATWRGTEVAVKVMLEQDLTRENTEDFFNELSLLCRLRHPNIILFMGACTSPPHLSMVTEFMHMGSLYRLIHMSGQGKKLSWRRRLKMLRDICRGMMCLQRMNIIHRDLKSANCLVDKHWCVKICDFGLSRLRDGPPIQEATAAGTPEWMAPELLRNQPVSSKCDVFSLGVIMWELCSLKRPWDGVQPLQVVHEVSVNKARLEIPQGVLGKLIADCWEENPQDRPDYEEILTRLHECEFLLG